MQLTRSFRLCFDRSLGLFVEYKPNSESCAAFAVYGRTVRISGRIAGSTPRSLTGAISREYGTFKFQLIRETELTFEGVGIGPKPKVYYYVRAPRWVLGVLLLLIPITFAVRRFHKVPKVRIGHCLQCGYDLRGTPEDTCSECGSKELRQNRRSRR